MSPASNQHGRFQSRLVGLLSQILPLGEVLSECSVETNSGVKVADVAWLSPEFLEEHSYTTPYPRAPEICVEVRSPSNSAKELDGKKRLYFGQGAVEVWICDSFGNLDFFDADGPMETSKIAPGFPERI